MITPPKCTCPEPVTLQCVNCYPTFTDEEKAYVSGHTHAAYRWAATPPTYMTDNACREAYLQGYNDGRTNHDQST